VQVVVRSVVVVLCGGTDGVRVDLPTHYVGNIRRVVQLRAQVTSSIFIPIPNCMRFIGVLSVKL